MAKFVPKLHTVIDASCPNGTEARFAHPLQIDYAQTYLIGGHDWAQPTGRADISADGTHNFPIVLRPWTEYISLAIRACLTDTAGTLVATLYDSADAAKISLMDLSLDSADLSEVAATPTTVAGWQAIPWYGAGSLGYSTPPASGKGALQVSPSNSWVQCYLRLVVADCQVDHFRIRCYSSPSQVV